MHIPSLAGPDQAAADATRRRIDDLTKPPGSLGAIERLAIRLSAIAPLPIHGYTHRAVLVGAADHGVACEGVSAYPAEVTPQMIGAFLGGFAAINAFARSANARVVVADFGVASELPKHEQLLRLAVAPGTQNLAVGPAMTPAQCEQALQAGQDAVAHIQARGPLDILALGDMGIGNTTSASALIAALTHTPSSQIVGRGTGIDDTRLRRKQTIIAEAVARCAQASPEAQIAALGGFEILGLAGAIIACAARRVPVLLDGVVVGAAAVVAAQLAPLAVHTMIATHVSVEPGHHYALEHLGLRALVDFDLRLGEGTGAALSFGFCDAAARMVGEMHTFAEAGVATAEETVQA